MSELLPANFFEAPAVFAYLTRWRKVNRMHMQQVCGWQPVL